MIIIKIVVLKNKAVINKIFCCAVSVLFMTACLNLIKMYHWCFKFPNKHSLIMIKILHAHHQYGKQRRLHSSLLLYFEY